MSSDAFDIPSLTIDDFEEDSPNARIFMAGISLRHIMGEIATAMSKKSPPIQDQPRITSLLMHWIKSLPKGLKLYNEEGSRHGYHFALSELYIGYFGTIILSTTLARQNGRSNLYSVLCLVAASCMAEIYEEVVYRDQVSFFGSIHGFWCMVAALPLLHCIPTKSAIESRRKESLGILCSVLEILRGKFGIAETAVQKVSDLMNERQGMLQQHRIDSIHKRHTQSDSWTNEQQISKMDSLFINVRQWYPHVDEILSDPGIERIEQTYFVNTENSDCWALGGLCPVDETSGASDFSDTLFEDIYMDENFGTSLM